MTKAQLPTNFSKHTSNNPIQKFLINRFYASLISLAKPLNPKTVLDAGCGEGFSLNRLSVNKIGEKLEGVENSKEAIALGKKLFPTLIFKAGSVYDLPYKKNSFDLVVCTEVLEHLNNPTKALREVLRVSNKRVIISIPNEPFFMLSNLLRGKNILRFGNDPEHINHWNILSFRRFLLKENLAIIKTALPFPWIIVTLKKTN